MPQIVNDTVGNFFWGGSGIPLSASNDKRHFWQFQGFSGSSEGVSFSVEGDGQVPVLRAQLRDQNGDLQQRDINLGERIGNNDGQFAFSQYTWTPQVLLEVLLH